MTTTATTAPPTTRLLDARYRAVTLGAVSLVFVAAFEALAVATVMPTVATDLHGERWYALAFSATVAASVVGMVLAGLWSDRKGSARPLLASVAVFAAGLVVAGLASGMGVLVAGRVAQGLGGGGLTVALYVLVAEAYDEADRPRILGAFAAAWVVPGIVGPLLAGAVADVLGWRWVFLGIVGVTALAVCVLVPTLLVLERAARSTQSAATTTAAPGGPRRLGLALVVAGGVLAASLVAGAGVLGAAAGVAAAVVALVAVRPLLPPGTFTAARGVPAVIAARGLAAATFFASEAFLPYLLQSRYGVSVALSGVVLTGATLGWAFASQVQGVLGPRISDATAVSRGAALLATGVAVLLLVVWTHLPVYLVGLGWVVAASGMGLLYPRVTSAVLARSAVRDRGRDSAAIALSDATGAATALALAGWLFTAAGGAAAQGAFVAVLALTVSLAVVGAVVARRV